MAKNTIGKTNEVTNDVLDIGGQLNPTETKEIRTRTPIDRNRIVNVMSVVDGTLVYISPKNQATWRFGKFGDVDDMDVSELRTMRASHPKFIDEPWLIIQDEEVAESFGLTEMYKNVFNPYQLDNFFHLTENRMTEIIKTLPIGMKVLVAQRAKELIDKGELDSLNKINLLETNLKVTFDPKVKTD